MSIDTAPFALSRRRFCTGAVCFACALDVSHAQPANDVHFNVAEFDRRYILDTAEEALKHQPASLTAIASSAKGLSANIYFSEGTEWWPTEGDHGQYSRRPGYINPQAFTQHRDALVQMNSHVAACVAAWRLTAEVRYAKHAMAHLRAWFVDENTRMQPQLDHAGCVPGQVEGTPYGIEETITLAETARSASFLCAYNGVATEEEAAALRSWFAAFATWLNESKKGYIARESKDRLAVCWTLQAAECARFARLGALQLECSHRFRDKLLRQMNFDGQFPAELHRADAYAASIFILDCMSVLCEVLSTPMDRYWDYTLPDGRGMRSAVAYLFPALENRSNWKLPSDAEHFSEWPVRQPSLLLAGRAYSRPEYLAVWKRLPPEPKSKLLLRYLPVRQPALWTVRPPAS